MSVLEASQLFTIVPLRFDTKIRYIPKQVESPARHYQTDALFKP